MNFFKHKISGLLTAAFLLAAGNASADNSTFRILGGDLSYNGLIRLETALSTTNQAAPSNQFGAEDDEVPIQRQAGNPLTNYSTVLDPSGSATAIPFLNTVLGGTPLGPTRGVSNLSLSGANDTYTRPIPREHPDVNYHVLRLELTPTLSWGDFSILARLRVLYDPGGLGYRDFDYRAYDNPAPFGNGKIEGGVPQQFHGKPSYFGYQVNGDKHPLLFERSGRNYEVDLPAFIFQYRVGNLTARLGNQTIAWGQLLFFRTFDTANGLDLRRHLIFNRAVEEYADVRESAPGLRLTYQATDQIVVDAFGQQFIPTILNNVNTPYNVVPSQFTIEDRYKTDGGEHHFNYGIKVKGDFGGYDLEAFYTRRYNQLGAIRWTKSGINKPLPSDNTLGAVFNQYCNVAAPAHGYAPGNGCGPFLADTAFEVAPGGVSTPEEWFNEAGYIKLDALDGLNKAVDDFPAAQAIFAQDIGHNPVAAYNELAAFFIASEGLRGHIERKYFLENVFGISGGYVLDAEPGSILDQLITHLDVTYTPKRVFTAVDLRKEFDKRDEIQVGLVAEKYQRFSQEFPATYLVFQYLWQKNSDLVGLLNDGYGSQNFSEHGIRLEPHVPTTGDPNKLKINPGRSLGSHYLVFAFVQPFPAYIYELSAAALIDPYGGLLIQPGLQWKPRGNVTVNLFYNYVNGHAWGNNANDNTVELVDFADEVAFRVGFQF